jgi:alpha-tubulin suppressor-like RCC1 family protein
VFESLAAGGAVLSDDIAQTSSTAGFSCGLVSGGKAYCWGANNQGQLGLGSQFTSVTTPQAVSGGVSFTGIRGGSNFICGLAVGGAGYCWGSNATGQFGDETTTPSTKPTQIFGN